MALFAAGFMRIQEATTAWRTWAEIDLDALLHNLAAMRKLSAPGIGVMAVVKANAYGHGAGPIVRALAPSVEMFGVANLIEAEEVRAELAAARGGSHPEPPILLLSPALPAERERIVSERFTPALSSLEEAHAYAALNRKIGRTPLPVHLKIDTGMGRIGIPENIASATVRAIFKLPDLQVAGLASHLPVADEDDAFTEAQLLRFHALIAPLLAEAQQRSLAPWIHVENSAGLIGFPQQAGTLSRLGLTLYGSAPRPEMQARLQPVMTWKTRVTLVRTIARGQTVSYGRTFAAPHEMRIATLAVGYADGYQRHLSNQQAEVLLRGRRCAVLGRVTMDQIMIDVTAVPNPEVLPGEEIVLLGRQEEAEISAVELAQKAGTIAWEILTGIGRRVPRIAQQRTR